jgi:hypothetical protein
VSATSGGDLTRVTVNLTAGSKTALDAARAVTGNGQTDAVNAAVRLYALVLAQCDDGSQLAFIRPDGTTERVWLL